MSVMKPPHIPPMLLTLFRTAPFVARRLVAAYLGRRPPEWQSAYESACAAAVAGAGMQSPGRVERIGKLPHRFIADVMFLRHAPLEAVARLPIRVLGAEHALPKPGLGTLFACSNLGTFYASFLRPPAGITEVLVITPTVPPEQDRELCHRIEALTGVKLILAEASTRSAIAIARQLRKGGAVATMLDSHLPGTPFLAIPFLGRPAATPRGIYEILSRMAARIVPVYNLRATSGFDVHYQAPILTEGKSPEALATAVNRRLEQAIRDNPEQWSMWAALTDRWETAEQVDSTPVDAEADAA